MVDWGAEEDGEAVEKLSKAGRLVHHLSQPCQVSLACTLPDPQSHNCHDAIISPSPSVMTPTHQTQAHPASGNLLQQQEWLISPLSG